MNDPAFATVRADQTIAEAFAAAAAADRVVLVVSGDGRLVGALADGDVRRGVAAGKSLDRPVAELLSAAPMTLGPQDSDERAAELFRATRLPALAVVDDAGRPTAVRRLADVVPELAEPPVGVLMVGGRGERLRPLTDKMPKPLLRIGGSAIVERLIDAFRVAGVGEVFLTVNYLAEMFEERLADGDALGVHLHYVREDQAMDTAGSLSLLPATDRLLLVSNGDLVTTVDFAAMVEFHRFHRSAITVAGVQYAAKVPYGVLRTAEHHLLHVDEKPTTHLLVNAGMYVLSPEVLRYVPGDKPYKMTELIDDVLRDGLSVSVFPVLERWSDIGSKEEFERVLFEFAVEEES